MTRQTLIVWLLAFYTVLLGGLATTSSLPVAVVFYVHLISQIFIHTFWLCPGCGNYECAINPKSPHFIFRGRRKLEPPGKRPAMNMNLPVISLAVTFLVGLYGVWLLSPIISYTMAWAGAIMIYSYSRVACRSCGNICIMKPR